MAPKPRPTNERFWEKVNKDGECWEWAASLNKGYGQFWVNSALSYWPAHRYSYLIAYGEILDGKEIHHECRNRKCVNPLHLTALTREEHNKEPRNLQPAIEATRARYAERTHCNKGHLLTDENTRRYNNPKGFVERRCRTCHREDEAGRRKRKWLS